MSENTTQTINDLLTIAQLVVRLGMLSDVLAKQLTSENKPSKEELDRIDQERKDVVARARSLLNE